MAPSSSRLRFLCILSACLRLSVLQVLLEKKKDIKTGERRKEMKRREGGRERKKETHSRILILKIISVQAGPKNVRLMMSLCPEEAHPSLRVKT